MTLWESRFSREPSRELLEFTASLNFDKRLSDDDLDASIVHVKGLNKIGILSEEETQILTAALEQVRREINRQEFKFLESDEDIHSAIERRVTEICGEVGGKLHTGRSRNDQVVVAFKLYIRRELKTVLRLAFDLIEVLLDKAEAHFDVSLPGYTHLQRAQPVLLSHHLLAHCWALLRDIVRIEEALSRINVSPLGAGAVAGSSIALDPAWVANELKFNEAFENSIDAVSDRDFVLETLFLLSVLGVHLSRISEEIILWSTAEFSFVTLSDDYSTGSSMLAQKKNPDVFELMRAKSSRLIGNLVAVLGVLKALPLAYNRDLQEDKEPVFDSFDQIKLGLAAIIGAIKNLKFNETQMNMAADTSSTYAIDLTEWLVQKGVAFRKAYSIIGALVKDSIERHIPLEELLAAHPDLGQEAIALIKENKSVSLRKSPGSTAPELVRIQMEHFKKKLKLLLEEFQKLQF